MSTSPSSSSSSSSVFPLTSWASRKAPDLATLVGGDSRQHPITVAVWNYYEELTTQGFIFQNAQASIGHNLLKPWVDLYHYGQQHGIHFVTLDQVSGPEQLDAVVFMDRPRADSAMAQQLLASDIPKYLCTFEPEIVKPDNWDLSFHQRLTRVFTFSDAHVDGTSDGRRDPRYCKLNFAMDPECVFAWADVKNAFTERKLCTVIAGAKHSAHPQELYSERVRAIRWFEAHAPQDFDLYGTGWQADSFPSYRGKVDDKLDTLSRYRFAICYENARGYPGYITEKILDCFRAGVVPVYLGAPNITRWIPADCFIDRAAFADEATLYAHLKAMDAATHAAYLDRIAAFLDSPQSHPFSIEYFINSLTSQLVKDVQDRRGTAPLVSVAIPAYNYGHYLANAIHSATVQTVPGLEILVFDNASTDQTAEVVAALPYANLRYMRQARNIGAPGNWHSAFQNASGRYIAMLSADDAFVPGHLQRMVALMEANPQIALCYCPCIWMNETGEPLYVVHPHGHPAEDSKGGRNEVAMLLAHDCFVTPSAALVRRSALEQVGNLNLQLQGAIDWDMWIRLAEQFPDFGFFKEPRVLYRSHGEQDTARLLKTAGLLADHVQILENALQRGGLARLAPMAERISALLQAKYASYPQDMVAHLAPRVAALVQQLQAASSAAPSTTSEPAAFAAARQGGMGLIDLINAANALIAERQPGQAADLYRLWLEHSGPAHAGLQYAAAFNLAILLEQLGDVAEAKRLYAQALQWNPSLAQAAQRLAQLGG